MEQTFGVEQVVGGPPPWSLIIKRGAHLRCGRCGAGDLFASRYRLRARCPACGYRFQREAGFFMGAWFVNFMVIEVVHFVMVMVFIGWKSQHPDAGLLIPLLAGIGAGVALPVLMYPWSQTMWASIDLVMTPLELAEIVDAADAVEADGDGGSPGRAEETA